MSPTRRWQVSFAVSVLLNFAIFLALGRFWQPPFVAAPAAPNTIRVAVYTPPRPRPAVRRVPPPPPPPARAVALAPRPVRPSAAPPPRQARPAPSGAASRPALAAPVFRPAAPTRQAEHSVLTSQRADAPPLAPLAPAPDGEALAAPTLSPTPGEGTGNGTGSGETGTGNGSGGTGTGGGGADGRGPFGIKMGTGGGGGPRHVVYVLDVSLSMATRIARARQELRTALTHLSKEDAFDIIAFAEDAQPFDSELISVSAPTIAQADYFLSTLPLRAGTNLEDALTRALAVPNVNMVVVITDGVPTVGETDWKKLARKIRARNPANVRINAIGLVGRGARGDDHTFEATMLLNDIVEPTGGDLYTFTVGTDAP